MQMPGSNIKFIIEKEVNFQYLHVLRKHQWIYSPGTIDLLS